MEHRQSLRLVHVLDHFQRIDFVHRAVDLHVLIDEAGDELKIRTLERGSGEANRFRIGVDRRDLSWVNQHHITEEKLDEAIRAVIAAYNRFQLPTVV